MKSIEEIDKELAELEQAQEKLEKKFSKTKQQRLEKYRQRKMLNTQIFKLGVNVYRIFGDSVLLYAGAFLQFLKNHKEAIILELKEGNDNVKQ
ncbi:MAG: hypothetical protein MJ133_07625 [Lachnospiraceae bacterium]|nr:hypothetical protein [Lachnospiraceae bacterium]